MEFFKMHGCGNDYIYVNCFKTKITNPSELAIRLSDYHKGIGGDGLILILPSSVADVRMQMFNNDGSEGKMCGNGIRCVAKFAYDNNLVNKKTFFVETLSGNKECTVFLDENKKVSCVSVDMGEPILRGKDIPILIDDIVINQKITIEKNDYFITAVSMGNPHMVIFLDDIKQLKLNDIGPSFENCPLFPDKVNTEFVKVINRRTLEMRVFERGTGETMACGTGACASVVAACLNNLVELNQEIEVRLLGGNLFITYTGSKVIMKGEAIMVFRGEI